MKAVIYARVSTEEQNTERQINELNIVAKNDNYAIVKVFQENISGTVKANKRPAFEEMINYLEAKKINQVYCYEVSRIGRNLRDTVNIIQDFIDRGINIYIKKEGLNTYNQSSSDKLQLNMLISLAEYERDTIIERTKSGTYNSIRNGGSGSGSIKQYGYKKENGKLVIDEDEAAVILDICDKYLNKDFSVKQIADYLNETGIETRYKKLINAGIIKYKVASDLVWTDGSVARLLHKKLLTGFRKYGKVEQQNESLRVIDDSTFDAIQIKMDLKRKSKANAQKYEHILRGTLVCGNCGSSMVMQKSKSGLQNHYQCYKRFTKKDKSCGSAMINIDLLNNVVYQKVKDFKVASKDVEKRINDFKNEIHKNQITLNRLNVELSNVEKEEKKLVELYMKEMININIYQDKLNELQKRIKSTNKTKNSIELSNVGLQEQIKSFENKKIVNLKNPKIFKANVKNLVESITVKNLDESDRIKYSKIAGEEIKLSHSRRHKYYRIDIKMFDNKTHYVTIISNLDIHLNKPITVERI